MFCHCISCRLAEIFHWRIGGAFGYKNIRPRWEKKRMIVSQRRQLVWLTLCFVLLLFSLRLDSGAAAIFQASTLSGNDYSGQGIPFATEELQALVAPIALYPDSLLAQTVVAATFPDQVLTANLWVQQNKGLSGPALVSAVGGQQWDPSIKALTLFPSILSTMAQNLTWTSQLGEAYHNQQSAVLAAVQSLRAKAKTEENLKSTPQMMMAQPSGDIITLQPGNPVLVYVPQFNPAKVYGMPIETPGYTNTDTSNGAISFGTGVGIGGLANTDWGWGNWACNWYQGVADYRNYPYFGNHAWHGNYYGGYAYYGNHTYHDQATRPFSSQGSVAGQQPGAQVGGEQPQTTGSKHSFAVSGSSNPPPVATQSFTAWARESGGWITADAVLGWGTREPAITLTAFSSWSNQPIFGVGGWGDRAASYRGWTIRGGSAGWGIGGRSTGLHW
jgi:hypothetical protein